MCSGLGSFLLWKTRLIGLRVCPTALLAAAISYLLYFTLFFIIFHIMENVNT